MGDKCNGQRVSEECLNKMDKMKLFDGRKSSFDKALKVLISFCEKNKRDFEKWKKSQQ